MASDVQPFYPFIYIDKNHFAVVNISKSTSNAKFVITKCKQQIFTSAGWGLSSMVCSQPCFISAAKCIWNCTSSYCPFRGPPSSVWVPGVTLHVGDAPGKHEKWSCNARKILSSYLLMLRIGTTQKLYCRTIDIRELNSLLTFTDRECRCCIIACDIYIITKIYCH